MINCIVCNKEFDDLGCRILCSKQCNSLYLKELKLQKKQYDTKCLRCGTFFNPRELQGYCSWICAESSSPPKQLSLSPTFWDVVYSALSSCSKIVTKDWGFEIWIINHKLYCLKYLVFYKDLSFSYHWHKIKQETWHCLIGGFEGLLNDKLFSFEQGDKIEILPDTKHQLRALTNSVIVEISTEHFDEDSYR